MAKNKDDNQDTTFTLPRGRVINCSLFVKDAFNDKAVPSYKIEIAIPEDDPALIDLENKLFDAADEHWGEGAGDDEDLVIPLLDGNRLAKKRRKKNKDGDAYDKMVVIRANTIYCLDGSDGPGGIQVFDEEVEPIEPVRKAAVYPGCYGEVAANIGYYEDDDGNNAMKFYLSAFQKTGDGEPLIRSADRSSLFSKTGTGTGGATRKRRSRKARD